MAIILNHQVVGDVRNPAMVFLHGFLGDLHDWDTVAGSLSEAFCCVVIDLPGHGLSRLVPRARHNDMEGTLRAIVRLLDKLHIHQCTLVGYSMGGRIALHAGLRAPERFHRLVIESATPGLLDGEERATRRKEDEALASELEADFQGFLARWYGQSIFASLHEHPDRLQRMLERRRQGRPKELAAALRALSQGTQPPLWNELDHLKAPALFMAGEYDVKYRELAQAAARACPRGEHVVVPAAGHNIHIERPDRYTELLREFLAATANGDKA